MVQVAALNLTDIKSMGSNPVKIKFFFYSFRNIIIEASNYIVFLFFFIEYYFFFNFKEKKRRLNPVSVSLKSKAKIDNIKEFSVLKI